MASTESLYLSALIRTGDSKHPISHNITSDLFIAHEIEWDWLSRYIRDHRRLPSKTAFQAQFPTFRFYKTDDLDHYTAELRKDFYRRQMVEMLSEAADAVSEDDLGRAIEQINGKMSVLRKSMHNDNEIDVFMDFEKIFKEVEDRAERVKVKGQAGIPTGFPTLDLGTGGPQAGHIWIAAARLGVGKALKNGTGVLTPSGYVAIETLNIGDRVIGLNGHSAGTGAVPTRVIGVYPQGQKEILKVKFSDGSIIEVCEDHLWTIRIGSKPCKVQTTKQIEQWLADKRQNPAVPTVQGPITFKESKVSYDAYNLGLLLGDGSFRAKSCVGFTTADPELTLGFGRYCRFQPSGKYQYSISSLNKRIRDFGLWGLKSHDKFIPEEYLWSSPTNRLAMVQGLMDTDGEVLANGGAGFSSTSPHLIAGLRHIVETLGGHCEPTEERYTHYTHNGEYRTGRLSYRMTVVMPPTMCPFRLQRKVDKWIPRTKYQPTRVIESITRTGEYDEMTCIAVSAPDSLFLTEHCIVTHNSQMLVKMAAAAVMAGNKVQFDSLEMSAGQVSIRVHMVLAKMRLVQGFSASGLMLGTNVNLPAYREYLEGLKRDIKGNLFISDTSRGAVGPVEIAGQIERNNPDLVLLDYMSLLKRPKNQANDMYQGVSALSSEIKNLAERYKVPITVASQINRQGTGKEPPGAEHLSLSDSVGQDADAVLTLSRISTSVRKVKLVKYRHGRDGQQFYVRFKPDQGDIEEISGDEADRLKEQDLLDEEGDLLAPPPSVPEIEPTKRRLVRIKEKEKVNA